MSFNNCMVSNNNIDFMKSPTSGLEEYTEDENHRNNIKHRNSGILNRLRLRKSASPSPSKLSDHCSNISPTAISQESVTLTAYSRSNSLDTSTTSSTTTSSNSSGIKMFMKKAMGSKCKPSKNDFDDDDDPLPVNTQSSSSSLACSKPSPSKSNRKVLRQVRQVNGIVMAETFSTNSPSKNIRKLISSSPNNEIQRKATSYSTESPSRHSHGGHYHQPPDDIRKKNKSSKMTKTKKRRKSLFVNDTKKHLLNSSGSSRMCIDLSLQSDDDESTGSEGSIQKKLRDAMNTDVDRERKYHDTKNILNLTSKSNNNLSSPLSTSTSSRSSKSSSSLSSSHIGSPPSSATNEILTSIYFDEDDDMDDDFFSDDNVDGDSDESTVVNELPPTYPPRPPPTASKEEQAKYYWDMCYGHDKNKSERKVTPLPNHLSWSASRGEPIKSCLSAKKISRNLSYNTPSPINSSKKFVKFGSPSAVEFDYTLPVASMTPLPSEVVKSRFPVDEVDVESDEESNEMHRMTARNSAVLAMWDDAFDSPRSTKRSSNRKENRRSSTFYLKNGANLLKDDTDDVTEVDNNTDKENSQLLHADLKNKMQINIDEDFGFDSFCDDLHSSISPMKSPYSISTRSSSSSGLSTRESIKDSPKEDIISSSSLLRSVHSTGGASMRRDFDDYNHDLRPNQLDSALKRAEFMKKSDTLINFNSQEFQKLLQCHSDKDYLRFHEVDIATSTVDFFHEQMNTYFSLPNLAYFVDARVSCSNSPTGILELKAISDFLKLSVMGLEKESPPDSDDLINRWSQHAIYIESIYQQHDVTFLEDMYRTFLEKAFHEWQSLEFNSFENTLPWLESIYDANYKEDAFLTMHIRNAETVQSDFLTNSQTKKHGNYFSRLRNRIYEEEKAIAYLEKLIFDEEQDLLALNQFDTFWHHNRCIQRHEPCVNLHYRTINHILPFEARIHRVDNIQIAFSHLYDKYETLICWKDTCDTEGSNIQQLSKRDSIGSVASSNSLNSVLTSYPLPTISRVRKDNLNTIQNEFDRKLNQDPYFSKGTFASEIYSMILNCDQMQSFMNQRLALEPDYGILSVSDIFERLSLLARDVTALQKYYNCRIDKPHKSSDSIHLHVIISLGQSCSIDIRFNYDLSNQTTLLHSKPSEVFITPIVGEPAVPINILEQVAKQTLSSMCNAFILKRTCTAVIDTIQGR